MSGIATAIAGSAIVSYVGSKKASKAAATATKDSAALATQEASRQFDVMQETLAPYRDIGEDFLPQLRSFMRGNYRGYLESPDYKFTLEEGEKAIGRKASAAGSRYGGRALKEAVGYAEGLASTFTDKYFKRLFNTIGLGSSAAAGTAQGALQTGQTNAGVITQAGQNLASINLQQGQNVSNIAQSTAGNLVTLKMYNDMLDKIG